MIETLVGAIALYLLTCLGLVGIQFMFWITINDIVFKLPKIMFITGVIEYIIIFTILLISLCYGIGCDILGK